MKVCVAVILFICFFENVSSQTTKTVADNPLFDYHGRTLAKNGSVELISPASYAAFQFEGDSCIISFTNIAATGNYNYVAVEIDNEYKGRIKIANTDPAEFAIVATNKKQKHILKIYKATEALTGMVVINYVKASRLANASAISTKRFEFIGNSITCGFGNDDREIPCKNGSKWYDQHNAYWSYAAIVSRSLRADFMLSAISGAGIYRNWNSDGPTVPQQYESAYLNIDSAERWNFSNYIPDIVIVALGTNDFSQGDGNTPRRPFDSATFVDTYIKFLKTIYGHYPATQIILITSPMVNGENAKKLLKCLKSVSMSIAQLSISPRRIKIFEFKQIHASGCDGHPSIPEHEEIANELLPFMQQVVKDLH